jgi:23S rRNA-/tRNA-specific pseudouridylate synthase
MEVYTIYDTVAKESGPLFYAKNLTVAQRSFNNLLKDLDEETRKEYELRLIGVFNTTECKFENIEV